MNICVKNKVNGNDGGVLIHEAKSPPPKKHSLSEIIKLNETFNLCGIWRVRNPHKNYSLSDKNISLVLDNKDLIIFSFLTVYKNQLKNRNDLSSDHSNVFCS